MPFCCQCGNAVGPANVFCARCGARQPVAAAPVAVPDLVGGIRPRTASLLCYIPVLGWLAAIVVLASSRFRTNAQVRFHAFQGLYLFVAWLLVDWVLSPIFHLPVIPTLFKAAVFGAWILMMIKVSQDEQFKLPILGELAEKSVSEQR